MQTSWLKKWSLEFIYIHKFQFGLAGYSPLCRRRQWQPTPVLLPRKSHGRRSLVGCSPWGREESDTTERLHFHFSLSCSGEGTGSPLQYSCPENPKDGGAWWAAIHGVTQSRTWLKWLSSSNMLLTCKEMLKILQAKLQEYMNCGRPGSSVHRIFQTRVLEWGAIAFSEQHIRLPQINLQIQKAGIMMPLKWKFYPEIVKLCLKQCLSKIWTKQQNFQMSRK